MSRNWHGGYVKRARRIIAATLPAPCWRCGRMVTEDMAWDVGHIIGRDVNPEYTHDPNNWAPEHSYCSRSAGARYGNAKRGGRLRRAAPTSRDW